MSQQENDPNVSVKKKQCSNIDKVIQNMNIHWIFCVASLGNIE